MATEVSLAPVSTDNRKLSGSLGVGGIVFMVVAAAAPLTVIGGAAPLGILIGDGAGYPLNFVISAVILLLFSVGLAAMSRAVPKPGAFFTYIGYGLGRPMGVGGAWLALLTYTTVQLAVYGYLGFSINLTLTTLGAPDLPWWLYSLAMIAVVGILGYRDVHLSAKVLGVFLIAEVGVTLALSGSIMFRGGAEGLSLVPFTIPAWSSGSPGIGLMMAFAGFIGFESTAIFRDEAKDPDKTIPRATYAAVIVIGLLYSFASWALVMAWGPSKVLDVAAADPGGMLMATANAYLGVVGATVMQGLLLTSLFACVLSFHNVLTRYQHAMGNVGLLPAKLGVVHGSHGSPAFSSLVQTATAAAILVILAVLGLDPVMQVFTWFSGITTIAIVVLMALTSVAVVAHFAKINIPGTAWSTRIAPGISTLGLIAVAGVIVAYFPDLVGGGWGLAGSLLATVPLFIGIGVVQGLRLRKSKPEVYANVIDSIS
ncbi:MAG: APC family permease [Propionicimonas sp.]|uniref:APC family permease n=2 Tax=Propionicimonas sp. TaxID=1955623 RepID=UPI00182FBAD5|nr:APC family permease [Propionicimonas sp.]MBU3977868.1 APC family permease [Actinomycetota bacterium]MBA3021909.1 APC family permease [Propionicimonas sp.]MBU3987645.1 APC family permease [Actinomycetota bacterium]MBU4007367.1 APC family permease [Actinomycetota bacterium]MBU4065687.1 APC family permease [Actinomycetota bacterium]